MRGTLHIYSIWFPDLDHIVYATATFACHAFSFLGGIKYRSVPRIVLTLRFFIKAFQLVGNSSDAHSLKARWYSINSKALYMWPSLYEYGLVMESKKAGCMEKEQSYTFAVG